MSRPGPAADGAAVTLDRAAVRLGGRTIWSHVSLTVARGDFVGATGYARGRIGELSGGEQQRLLIAQALVRRPSLLLLDEPLDSLDLPSQVSVAALVGEICRREQVAVLLVAHDINPILGYL